MSQLSVWNRFVLGARALAGDEEADAVQGPVLPRSLDGTMGEVGDPHAGCIGQHDLIAIEAELDQESTVGDVSRHPVAAPRSR